MTVRPAPATAVPEPVAPVSVAVEKAPEKQTENEAKQAMWVDETDESFHDFLRDVLFKDASWGLGRKIRG